MDDHRLDRVLRSVGADLDIPDVGPLSVAASPVATSGVRRRWLQVAAAAIVLMLAISLGPVRDTVASWLGVGSTEVRTGQDDVNLETLPALEDGVAAIDRDVGRGHPRAPAAQLAVYVARRTRAHRHPA